MQTSSPTLLLIEDEPDIRDSLREILEAEGYAVRTAANGAEGLAALEAMPAPDLILLDLLMPVMNGTEFLAEQQKRPTLSAIPVVVLSADSALAPRPRVYSHVRKPVDLTELLLLVKEASA